MKMAKKNGFSLIELKTSSTGYSFEHLVTFLVVILAY